MRAGASGTVNVEGKWSSLLVSDKLSVGDGSGGPATGTLNIRDFGLVSTNNHVYLGRFEGSTGTIILESDGYLAQPHTSAGRVPTDAGFRHYVDTTDPARLRATTKERINEFLKTEPKIPVNH